MNNTKHIQNKTIRYVYVVVQPIAAVPYIEGDNAKFEIQV